MLIEDGRTGKSAAVSYEGMLHSLATIKSMETHHSEVHGSSYMVGNGMITASGTDNVVLYLKNTSQTDLLYIHEMSASTTAANAYISMHKNPVYSSGGVTTNPVNMNFTKADYSNIDVYTGNSLTLSEAGTPILGGYIATGITSMSMKGAIILGYNDSLCWKFNATTSSKGSIGVRFYYHGGLY